jgi:hypothetical protein
VSLQVLTAASSTNLTTVSRVKVELGVTTGEKDAWISQAIPAASKLIEGEANNFWAYQQYLETIPGSGSARLVLARTPVIGTPTIVIDNGTVADFTVEDADAGILYRRQGWTQEVSYWPNTIKRDPNIDDVHPSIYVTYYAGFNLPSFSDPEDGIAYLPANIERACILTVKAWYLRRQRDPDVSWKQVGDFAIGYRKQDSGDGLGLPPDARALISQRVF